MKGYRLFLLVAVAGILGLPAASLGANVRITNHGTDQNEPMVAIKPTDHTKMVVAFNDSRSGSYRVGWAWSDNSGRSWNFGGTFTPAGYALGADPVVAFDTAGSAYIAGLAYNPDNTPGSLGCDGSVFLAKSNDDGRTFTVLQKIVFAGAGTASYYDKPWLHVNPANSHVYLAWAKRSNAWGVGGAEAITIEFARSVNGGTNFSNPVQVSSFSPATGTSRSHGPQIATGPGQKVYVAWHTLEGGQLGPGFVPPKIWIAESTDGGASFGSNYLVATIQNSLPNRFVSLGVNRANGRLYVAYAARPTYPGDHDVYVATATAAAGPWTSTRINDDPVGNGRGQFWPSLGVAPNGRVDIIWYDFRDDPNRLNVYYTYSSDGGARWAANDKLTDIAGFTPVPSNRFAGDYSTVAAADEKAYAVWMDNRLGDQEIYGTEVVPPPAPPSGLRIQ